VANDCSALAAALASLPSGLLEMVADAVAALGVAEVSALAVTERTVNVPAASKPLKKSAVKAFLDRSFRALGLAITPPTRDPPFLSSTGVDLG
jgi:hypothetical protein